MSGQLPRRSGPRPAVTTGMPHQQLGQQPAEEAVPRCLAQRVFVPRTDVHEAPSRISVPGARALVLDEGVPTGPTEAFIVGREFAHLHPAPDHSLHMALPLDIARDAIAAGWAEQHIAAASGQAPPTVVMVYAPRDDNDIDVVLRLLDESYRFATNHIPPTRRNIMSPEEMDELIEAHIAAESSGDPDGTVAMFTDDIEHDVVGFPTGPSHGVAEAHGFYTQLMRDIHTEQMALSHSYHGDDFCVTEHQWTGTVPGTFLGVPGNGRRISFRLLHVWEFRDGRISRENAWLDGGTAVAQLTEPTP